MCELFLWFFLRILKLSQWISHIFCFFWIHLWNCEKFLCCSCADKTSLEEKTAAPEFMNHVTDVPQKPSGPRVLFLKFFFILSKWCWGKMLVGVSVSEVLKSSSSTPALIHTATLEAPIWGLILIMISIEIIILLRYDTEAMRLSGPTLPFLWTLIYWSVNCSHAVSVSLFVPYFHLTSNKQIGQKHFLLAQTWNNSSTYNKTNI